jgi:hypothetical protein
MTGRATCLNITPAHSPAELTAGPITRLRADPFRARSISSPNLRREITPHWSTRTPR